MGFWRLFLAIAVVITHGGGVALVGGQVAVQTFFIFSGFYMSLILNEKYQNDYLIFLYNRFLRIFPMYWGVLFGTLALYAIVTALTDAAPVFGLYASTPLSISTWVVLVGSQLFVFGQDILHFFGILPDGSLDWVAEPLAASPATYQFMFLPQGWSLGVELLFYLVAPWLLRRSVKTILVIIVITLLVRGYIYFGLNLMYDPYTLRFFPTEICLFLLGNLAYRRYAAGSFSDARYGIWGLGIFGVLYFYIPIVLEIKQIIFYLGMTWALPWLFHHTKNNASDRLLGELSYPVYLVHILVRACLWQFSLPYRWVWIVVLSIIAGWILNQLVGKPLEKFKREIAWK